MPYSCLLLIKIWVQRYKNYSIYAPIRKKIFLKERILRSFVDHGVGSSDQSPVINSFFAKQVARLLKPFVAVALQPVQKVARLHEVARAFWVF